MSMNYIESGPEQKGSGPRKYYGNVASGYDEKRQKCHQATVVGGPGNASRPGVPNHFHVSIVVVVCHFLSPHGWRYGRVDKRHREAGPRASARHARRVRDARANSLLENRLHSGDGNRRSCIARTIYLCREAEFIAACLYILAGEGVNEPA